MKEIDLPPFAPALIESMRAIGYSLETAIADILDNSVAAKSRNIDIKFLPGDDPYLAILDDGIGLSEGELTHAMQHGSQNPTNRRQSNDLGRFGLGLKTASLSQCKQLTVVSKKNGSLSGCRWDLDVIARTQKWTLLSLDSDELAAIPHIEELGARVSGTLVLWRALDRLVVGESSIENALGEGMLRVRNHVALVFHRFLSNTEYPHAQISITINASPIEPHDPFLQAHKGIQKLQADEFEILDATVRVQPFILPHYSRMSEAEKNLAAGEDGLLGRQGFYVYRSRRLIVGGTWFRLARREELTKLARIQVDIPNSLDHLWTLDIKKSVVFPPAEVRANLSRTVDRIAGASRQVYTFRGRATTTGRTINIWSRIEGREGIYYRVNRDHPVISSIQNLVQPGSADALETVLREIEQTFPVEALYVDMGSDRNNVKQRHDYSDEELLALASEMLKACHDNVEARERILNILPTIEPFSFNPTIAREIVTRVRHAQ